MKCPICGAKLVAKQMCPYCKITSDQITNASNKKVKEYRQAYKNDLVYYSTVLPKDISRLKLILYTIFLGFAGVHHFYVLRPIRGLFSAISSAGSLILTLLSFAAKNLTGTMRVLFDVLLDGFFLAVTINIILWVLDIFAVVFKSYKVPVVLADK